MHQESQTANVHHDALRHRHEILGSGQLEAPRHRLQADADSHHARQGIQATSSSTFAEIARRATGLLETVQTYFAALSRQNAGQDLCRHHDSDGDQGLCELGGHQQECHTSHLSTLLCDRTSGSGRGSADDQPLIGPRQLLHDDGLSALSSRALDQHPQSAGLVTSATTADLSTTSGERATVAGQTITAGATTTRESAAAKLSVAQILRQGAAAYVRQNADSGACGVVQSTLAKLSLCRTPALGGNEYACDSCGETAQVPHSCGDRHCPICSGRKRFDFAQRAEQLILDGVTYYQVVFTLPSELSELALVSVCPEIAFS